jgi:hypothetical protein
VLSLIEFVLRAIGVAGSAGFMVVSHATYDYDELVVLRVAANLSTGAEPGFLAGRATGGCLRRLGLRTEVHLRPCFPLRMPQTRERTSLGMTPSGHRVRCSVRTLRVRPATA